MCQNSTKNNKINRMHERCFCLVYNDKKSSKSASIHHKNLAIEIYQVLHGIPQDISIDLFPLR